MGQEDITEPKCRTTVKQIMAEIGCWAFALILHDGSPNVVGAWAKETTKNSLVIDLVKLATDLLAPKGTFVTKVFRSQEYTAVLYCLIQELSSAVAVELKKERSITQVSKINDMQNEDINQVKVLKVDDVDCEDRVLKERKAQDNLKPASDIPKEEPLFVRLKSPLALLVAESTTLAAKLQIR